jgi:hypothetical protein
MSFAGHRVSLVATSAMSALLALATTVAVHAGGTITTPSGASFDYARRADALIVRYQVVMPVREGDPGPKLEVYGDGRVVKSVPEYMHDSGRYEMRLDEAALERLIGELVEDGLAQFDRKRVLGERLAAEKALAEKGGSLSAVIEESTTVIELNLAQFTPAGTVGNVERDLAQRITWSAIRKDAERFPELKALEGLARAEGRLRALMASREMERAEGAR